MGAWMIRVAPNVAGVLLAGLVFFAQPALAVDGDTVADAIRDGIGQATAIAVDPRMDVSMSSMVRVFSARPQQPNERYGRMPP
jgi:hypothetical protein